MWNPPSIITLGCAFILCSIDSACGQQVADQGKPEALQTRTYFVAAPLLEGARRDRSLDPFGAQSAPAVPLAPMTRDILADQGIPLPAGSVVLFDHKTSTLTVRNTAANLELVDTFVSSIDQRGSQSVVITAHLVRAPSDRLRQLASRSVKEMDQGAGLRQLLADADRRESQVKVLHSGLIENSSAHRGTLETVTEYVYPADLALDAGGRAAVASEMRPLGFRWEADALLGQEWNEARGIELNFSPELTLLRSPEKRDPVTGGPYVLPLPEFDSLQVTTAVTVTA